MLMIGGEVNQHAGTAGMTSGITNCLFKDQKQIPPRIDSEFEIRFLAGGVEFEINVTQSKYFIGVLTHLPNQIMQTIALRVDSPNDVAHRSNRLAGNLGD